MKGLVTALPQLPLQHPTGDFDLNRVGVCIAKTSAVKEGVVSPTTALVSVSPGR